MIWPDTKKHEVQILDLTPDHSIKYDPFRPAYKYTVLSTAGRIGDYPNFRSAVWVLCHQLPPEDKELGNQLWEEWG